MAPMKQNPKPILFTDALVFNGEAFVENVNILLADGRIQKISSEPITAPEDCLQVSAKGYTLLPGLIDAHIHGLEGNPLALEQSLRFGVTTVMDMHNDARSLQSLKSLAADETAKDRYADFKCAGEGATIKGGWPGAVIVKEYADNPDLAKKIEKSLPQLKTVEEAEAFVDKQVQCNGAEYIKLMHELGDTIDMQLPRPPLEIQTAVVRAAHAHGKIAVGHAFSHAGAVDLLLSGADGLTHAFLDRPSNSDWLDLMRKNKAHCNPTLGCLASQAGEGDQYQIPFSNDPLAKRMLFDKAPRHNLGFAANNAKASFSNVVQTVREMYAAGIPLIVGSDCAGKDLGGAYGLGVHLEMYLMSQKIGMKADQVLNAATALTADRFGFGDRGRIAEGLKADVMLLEGDARSLVKDESVLCLPIKGVWRDGISCSAYESL